MSVISEKIVHAHENIYKQHLGMEGIKRDIKVRYSIPSSEMNEETGMLVLVPGYGGNLDSGIFKKMMQNFADEYNLVVVQCDYFGNKFMGDAPSEFSKFILQNLNVEHADLTIRIPYKQMGESVEEFNDCGIMQALDVVAATLFVIYLLMEEKKFLNTNRIILFGSSHGGYLCHLSNLICPNLYSYIVDVCAYTFPFYLENERELRFSAQNKKIFEEIEQFITKNTEIQYDRKLYDIEYMYRKIGNRSKIISFQGIDDTMVPWREKAKFIEQIQNAEMVLVTKEMVDNKLFKSTEHSLGLDFIEFFKVIMPMIDASISLENTLYLDKDVTIGNDLWISYETGFPIVKMINFGEKLK